MALREDEEPDRAGACQLKQATGHPMRLPRHFGVFLAYRVLAPAGGLWQEPARLLGPFGPISPVIPGMLP
jgi:hypothetical protein